MRKWKKSQLQAYIDKHGPVEGPIAYRLTKCVAAQGRWKAYYREKANGNRN